MMARLPLPLLTLAGLAAVSAHAAEPLRLGAADPPTQVAQASEAAPPEASPPEERRRPGPRRVEPERIRPVIDPNAVPPPQASSPRESVSIPDRWRLVDALGLMQERLWDPYSQNTLKGDKPIFGEDWFLNLSVISDTVFEPRRVPTPTSFAVTARPNELGTFGKNGQFLINQNIITTFSLIKGNTAYKPQDIEIHITPIFNVNYLSVEERGITNINPARGTDRSDYFLALQEAFVDYHLRNVSERFDFDSLRVGIQPFNADFRGFLFQDAQLGIRLFGNRDNNHWQYNLAYFRRFDKDTNSGLNDVSAIRNDDIVVANLYRQDFPVRGFTSQVTYLFNHSGDTELHLDKNDFPVRPALIGDTRPRKYDVHYLGLNGDGHFGRYNLTTSFYYAFGTDQSQFTVGRNNRDADISAFFAAAEPSIDFDWIRVRGQIAYASGDGRPQDGVNRGFDAPFENPIFAGADTSYWIRQSIPFIAGGAVGLKTRNGLLPDLRSSKDEGQSNFVNPGLFLVGLGADFDLLPELRLSTNFNYLSFADTASLEFLRQQGTVSPSIGYDLSAALTYRPGFIQNVVLRLSGAVLIPGNGLKDLYNLPGSEQITGGKFLYSVLANAVLSY